MKKIVKWLVPDFLQFLLKCAPAYYYDLKRYYKYSATRNINSSSTTLTGRIIKEYHVIEKGLTMPDARLGFGKDKMISLIKNCITFIKKYGQTNIQILHAIGVIYEYKNFHEKRNAAIDPEVLGWIEKLGNLVNAKEPTQQKIANRVEYFSNTNSKFPMFSDSRSSIRNFSNENVDIDILKEVIKLSRNAPSACNRQTSRVYIYSDKNQIEKILKIQGGSRGFSHLTNKLILVTAELGVFSYVDERNQAFIDGGIFSMNVLYALHYHKIAACILNCSTTIKKDRALRELCNIKPSESFIAMIGCGHLPDNFQIAISKRSSVEEIVTVF